MLCKCLLCNGVHQQASVLHWDTIKCMQSTGPFPPVSVALLTPQADLQSAVYWAGDGNWRTCCNETGLCFAVNTSWMFFPCRMSLDWSWSAPPSCPTCSPSSPTVLSQMQCSWLCSPSSPATSSACGRARRARRCTAGWVPPAFPSRSQTGQVNKTDAFYGLLNLNRPSPAQEFPDLKIIQSWRSIRAKPVCL